MSTSGATFNPAPSNAGFNPSQVTDRRQSLNQIQVSKLDEKIKKILIGYLERGTHLGELGVSLSPHVTQSQIRTITTDHNIPPGVAEKITDACGLVRRLEGTLAITKDDIRTLVSLLENATSEIHAPVAATLKERPFAWPVQGGIRIAKSPAAVKRQPSVEQIQASNLNETLKTILIGYIEHGTHLGELGVCLSPYLTEAQVHDMKRLLNIPPGIAEKLTDACDVVRRMEGTLAITKDDIRTLVDLLVKVVK